LNATSCATCWDREFVGLLTDPPVGATVGDVLFDAAEEECAREILCAAGLGVTLIKSFADQNASRALCPEPATAASASAAVSQIAFRVPIDTPQPIEPA
jgi:hypothetical protein